MSESTTETVLLSLVGVAAGIGACYFLHKFLENKWQLEKIELQKEGIESIGNQIE